MKIRYRFSMKCYPTQGVSMPPSLSFAPGAFPGRSFLIIPRPFFLPALRPVSRPHSRAALLFSFRYKSVFLWKIAPMNRILILLTAIFMTGCGTKKEKVDLLVKDATIYTVDSAFTTTGGMAIRDGRVVATGNASQLEQSYEPADTLSLPGKFIYPGWNDPHAHFTGYGLSLNEVDLTGTTSPQEIIERCRAFAEKLNPAWITGRGWDQNDWEEPVFPDRTMLDRHFPDTPVLLKRVDGHAAWVNTRALEVAGLDAETRVEGGEILLRDGEMIGILLDNAIDRVASHIEPPGKKEVIAGLLKAQENCFAVGLTSVTDAGLDTETIRLIDSLQQSGALHMRINAMVNPTESNYRTFVEKGVLHNPYLTVNTVKLYADGALGSRGARLIEPYSDDPGNRGILVTPEEELREHCRRAYEHGYQVATHCIGDGANRLMLKIYGDILGGPNNRRWRIEHAQVIHPADVDLFKTYNVVPSVQTTHATSDMYWADERLGDERLRSAYIYKTLLEQNGWLPNGSDFPVESINPLYGFYAGVARKDLTGYPEGGFMAEEALSREQALRAMTSWAAKASFDEGLKGSLEEGKLADFVVTGEDIMTIPEGDIPHVRVLHTFSGGEEVFARR